MRQTDATHYEHGPGCTLGVNGGACEACRQQYPRPERPRQTCAFCGAPATCQRPAAGPMGKPDPTLLCADCDRHYGG